jgi:hypothetical protein
MALILAIEPDKKQASAVRALARTSLHAQILVADSTSHGLQQLDGRIPDLILTSLLLSPKDEGALDKHLRGLDAEGHRVPTLVIPVLGPLSRSKGGLLTRLKKPRKTTGTEGCDPATFAAQITEYLDRAAAERALDEPDDDPPLAARSRRSSIRDDKRPDSDQTPSLDLAASSERVASADAAASSSLAASFNASSTPDPPAPQPVEEPIVSERILKDPFSTEGLSRPAERRADSTQVYGSILFAESPRASVEEAVRPADVPSPADGTPGEPATRDRIAIGSSSRESELPPQKTDEDGAWDEIAIEESDTSLEITAEPIDLNAFVEELEAVVSSYGKADTAEPFKRPGDRQGADGKAAPRPTKAPSDPPIGLVTRYAWPALEGLPAGTDWETTAPGDPDYEMLAGFMAAFEEPLGLAGSRKSKAAPIEPVVVVPAQAPRAVDRESWISLAMRHRYSWPPLEGIECVDLLAEIEPDETGLYSYAEPEPPPARARAADPPRLEAKAPTPRGENPIKPVVRVEAASRPVAPVQAGVRTPAREPAANPARPVEFPARTAVRVEAAPRVKPPVVPASTPPAAANQPDRAAAPVVSAPPAAQWLEILTAIRRDIQELRAEHRAEASADGESIEARAPGVARAKGAPSATADDAARSAKARKTQPPAPSQKPSRKRKRATPPKQDEWGFFDPDQCGFAALLAKLEEIEGDEPTTPEQS